MKTKKTSLKDYLSESLNKEELDKVNRSFEIVGDIAIVEICEELVKYEKQIARSLLKVNSAIKVILKKSGVHHGEFRTQDLINIGGENRVDTIYKENGVLIKINPASVYFSARLSTEREQLMEKLEENKKVLVMFSGCGPYTFVALKKQPNLKKITSIEINPQGHKYALESLKLNKNLLKKSSEFKKVIEFLKKKELPVYEKKILELLNKLKINFINQDVKETVKILKFNKDEKIQETLFDNNLFKKSPKEIFKFLTKSNQTTLNFNFNEKLNKEFLKIFFIIFSEDFTFKAKIEDNFYTFENWQEKSYFLQIINGENLNQICLFDEIYMPLPKDAQLFLEPAFEMAEKNAIIHMYDFLTEEEFPHKSEEAIKKVSGKFGREVKILQTRKVGQYAPRKFRVCCDFKVLN